MRSEAPALHERVLAVKRVLAVSAVALCLGCAPKEFRPPRGDQPHAVVKLRRTYVTGGGSNLHENASILTDDETTSGRVFGSTVDSSLAGAPRVDGVLVWPMPLQLTLDSDFFHYEQRQVQETYQVQVPYSATETYDCSSGYGATRTYQTCTRQTTQYRSESRTRSVTRTVEISDGACTAKTILIPAQGHVYLVDYTYHARGACEMTCVEQVALPGEGQFRTLPCPR